MDRTSQRNYKKIEAIIRYKIKKEEISISKKSPMDFHWTFYIPFLKKTFLVQYFMVQFLILDYLFLQN